MIPLRRNLPEHFQESGVFSPFNYSIGLESSLQEATAAAQTYPLPQPVDDETYLRFARSLTLIHEATHVAQFFATSFGLKTLRYTLILLKRLTEGSPWTIPLLQTLANKDQKTDAQQRVLESCLLFLDAIDQIRLHQEYAPPEPGRTNEVEVDFLPWTPAFFLDARTQDMNHRLKMKDQLESVGHHVRRLPVLRYYDEQTKYGIVLNGAALMETYAAIAELNHIWNAFGGDLREGLALLPSDNRYHALIRYALQTGVCDVRGMIPTLLVCIDAALMYDAFVLFDVPWDAPDEEGRAEQYVGETFLAICDAVRKIGQLESNSDDDVVEFHRSVCAEAGLPSPEWMTEKALGAVERIIGSRTASQSEHPLLRNTIIAHRDALILRRRRGSVFPFYLPRMEPLFEIVQTVLASVSFYNLHTHSAESFDPAKIDSLTVHSILLQAIGAERIECPLKMGEPFFCGNTADPNLLCVWISQKQQRDECLVDVLERLFGFKANHC